MNSGELPSHIQGICAQYKKKRDAMLGKLESFPDGISYTVPDGGLFIWLTLPDGVDAMPIFKAAVDRGVAFVPGTHFFPGGGHENTLRLNFSMPSLEQIDKGMDILYGVIEENL